MADAIAESRIEPPPAPPQRAGTVRTATILAGASVTMFIGGLLGQYAAARRGAEDWPGVDIPNVAAAMALITLLMSSVTVQWGVSALRAGDRRNLYVASGLTLVLAAAFVNALAFVWSTMGVEVASDFGTAFYTVTGAYVVLLAGAAVALAVITLRALAGEFTPRDSELVQAGAALWHFTVGAFVLVWFVVFLLEGTNL